MRKMYCPLFLLLHLTAVLSALRNELSFKQECLMIMFYYVFSVSGAVSLSAITARDNLSVLLLMGNGKSALSLLQLIIQNVMPAIVFWLDNANAESQCFVLYMMTHKKCWKAIGCKR